jgi:methylated-DNA-[protein]-cysteine S-methyltransferase
MTHYFDTFSTPFGEYSISVNESGAVTGMTTGGVKRLQSKGRKLEHNPKAVAKARREVEEFFEGNRQDFTVEIAPEGTEFQKRVWSALCQIPYGKTWSYGQLAAVVGNPKASRAVGAANGANPICVIVPCHRCIGADGSLVGFGLGLPLKRRLLDFEREHAQAAQSLFAVERAA